MKYRYNSTKGRYLLAEFDGQVQSLPTASAAYEGTVYQYVGETDANYTHGYYYECISDGAVTPTYSWVQTNVQPQSAGDYIEKVTTMPTASSTEEGNEYQYMGADDLTNGLIHAHFYECVSDGESTPTYSWQDLGYKRIWGPGPKADWDALSVAEKTMYDEAHWDDDDTGGNLYPDWDNAELILTSGNTYTVTRKGYICGSFTRYGTGGSGFLAFTLNNVQLTTGQGAAEYCSGGTIPLTPVKEGDVAKFVALSGSSTAINQTYSKIYFVPFANV